jgi:monoamine oxidase
MDIDVIVVGAGLAGLQAANTLVEAGRRVALLEARDRVGGRVLNHTWADGSTGELGAQWIGPTQDHVIALAEASGLELYPSYEAGTHQAILHGKHKRFVHDTYGLPPFALLDGLQAQMRLQAMARSVPLEDPASADRAVEWDGMTLESWLRRHMRTRLGRDFFRGICASIFCAEAQEVSLLHFLFYVHSGNSIEHLLRLKGGAQESRVVGGTGRLAMALADRLGDVVKTSCPVRLIRQDEAGVTVVTDHGSHRAERVIVTLPPPLAGRLQYEPPLPPLRDQLTQKVAMGAVIKCMARYERPFWRDRGLSGFAISVDRPVNVILDNSPADGDGGVLVGFIDGAYARRVSELSDAERERVVLETFAEYFGPEAARPVEYVDKDWSADPWTRGCYGGHFAPGVWTQFGEALRRPCGRIHWAGTETAAVWNGYMDGALRSGVRAAGEVDALLGRSVRPRTLSVVGT